MFIEVENFKKVREEFKIKFLNKLKNNFFGFSFI